VKLPEADFRPKRRAGYVPAGPRRKIPILRILLILIAGVFAYLKFDVLSPWLRAWFKSSHASHVVLEKSAASKYADWSFSPDSTLATLNCRQFKESEYCTSLEQLQQGLCRQVRATLAKARWFGALKNPALSQVDVHLVKTESDESHFLTGLQGQDSAGKFHYERTYVYGEPTHPFCDSTRGCLVPPAPRFPLEHGKLTAAKPDDTISWMSSKTASVFPVLRGKVVSVDSISPQNSRVLLYHGEELYTLYEGLRHIDGNLKPGTFVEPRQSIGSIALGDSLALSDTSKYPFQMRFRVEQAGMILDAAEFLAAAEGKSNGR